MFLLRAYLGVCEKLTDSIFSLMKEAVCFQGNSCYRLVLNHVAYCIVWPATCHTLSLFQPRLCFRRPEDVNGKLKSFRSGQGLGPHDCAAVSHSWYEIGARMWSCNDSVIRSLIPLFGLPGTLRTKQENKSLGVTSAVRHSQDSMADGIGISCVDSFWIQPKSGQQINQANNYKNPIIRIIDR